MGLVVVETELEDDRDKEDLPDGDELAVPLVVEQPVMLGGVTAAKIDGKAVVGEAELEDDRVKADLPDGDELAVPLVVEQPVMLGRVTAAKIDGKADAELVRFGCPGAKPVDAMSTSQKSASAYRTASASVHKPVTVGTPDAAAKSNGVKLPVPVSVDRETTLVDTPKNTLPSSSARVTDGTTGKASVAPITLSIFDANSINNSKNNILKDKFI